MMRAGLVLPGRVVYALPEWNNTLSNDLFYHPLRVARDRYLYYYTVPTIIPFSFALLFSPVLIKIRERVKLDGNFALFF